MVLFLIYLSSISTVWALLQCSDRAYEKKCPSFHHRKKMLQTHQNRHTAYLGSRDSSTMRCSFRICSWCWSTSNISCVRKMSAISVNMRSESAPVSPGNTQQQNKPHRSRLQSRNSTNATFGWYSLNGKYTAPIIMHF